MTSPSASKETSPVVATAGAARRAVTLPRSPAFWVGLVVLALAAVLSVATDTFATRENLFNVTRNFAFIGLMALGQVLVIVSGGIDLSTGSVLGLAGIVTALVLEAGHSLALGAMAGIAVALLCGLVNGGLIAYLRLSPFVVTLGMLSIARSVAIVLSQNKMIYEFGPSGDLFNDIGGGQMLGIAHPVWMLIFLALLFGFVFRLTSWGRYLYAIGGNENAARLTGVPVDRIKLQAYIVSGLTAAIASVMLTGWQGSALNNMGIGWELRVIAATVIGGASLLGGEGGAYGAVIGAALIEVIRNSLLMAGVDANWQGTFVGLFIIFAVLLQRFRGRRGD